MIKIFLFVVGVFAAMNAMGETTVGQVMRICESKDDNHILACQSYFQGFFDDLKNAVAVQAQDLVIDG